MLDYIFTKVKERIKSGCTEIKTVKIYNSQDDFSDEFKPIVTPAVLIDFSDIEYNNIGYNIQEGNCEMTTKLFYDSFEEDKLYVYNLDNKVTRLLHNWSNWPGTTMSRVSTETDINFDKLYVLDTIYSFTFQQDLTDHSNIIPIGDWSHDPNITSEGDYGFSVTGLTENNNTAFTFNIPYSANTQN